MKLKRDFLLHGLWLFLLCQSSILFADKPSLPPVARPFSAYDFSVMDMDGKQHRLSDYRGKIVVLNFWATWCPPCREEMPSMDRAHKKLIDDDIVILAINVGEDEDTIFKFTGDYPVDFPLLLDRDGEVIKRYPVMGLPTTYIISAEGQVTHRAVGGRAWDDERLLNELRHMQKKSAGKPLIQ